MGRGYRASYLTDCLDDFLRSLMLLNSFCVPKDEIRRGIECEWEGATSPAHVQDNTKSIKGISSMVLFDLNLNIIKDTLLHSFQRSYQAI
jgi:hypothetical protein